MTVNIVRPAVVPAALIGKDALKFLDDPLDLPETLSHPEIGLDCRHHALGS